MSRQLRLVGLQAGARVACLLVSLLAAATLARISERNHPLTLFYLALTVVRRLKVTRALLDI